MASVNSVSFYSQLTARNKAIGGLASGLDTDALVEALTMSTRSRLATQGQQKTLINWRMTAYRGVAATLRAFQTKHLSMAAGANSLKANAFFNVYKGTSTSDKITVKAGNGSQLGSFTVDSIQQLATSQTFTIGGGGEYQRELVSTDTQVDQDYIGKTLQLSMNGTVKTIKLDSLQGLQNDGTSAGGTAFATELQRLVNNAFGANTIQVEHTLDEAEKTFSLKFSGALSSTSVEVRNTADSLGLTAGMSNRLNLSTKLSEFLEDEDEDKLLLGDTLKFSINDTVITVGRDDTIQTFLSRVNSSAAGVTAAFNSLTEQFVITSKTTGAGDNLRMQDVQGNLLNLFVGAKSGNSFASDISYDNAANHTGGVMDFKSMLGLTEGESLPDFTTDAGKKALDALKDYKMKLTVGGTALVVSADVSAYKNQIAAGELGAEEAVLLSINAQLEKSFGKDAFTLAFSGDSSSPVQFHTTVQDQSIKLETVSGSKDAAAALGLKTGQLNNRLSLGYDKTTEISATDRAGTLQDGKTYKLDMTINGETKTLSFTWEDVARKDGEKDADYNKRVEQALANKLNTAKSTAFGTKGSVASVKFQLTEEGKLSVATTSQEVGVTLSTAALESDDEALNFFNNGTSLINYTGGGTKLTDIGIAPGEIEIKIGGAGGTVTIEADDTLHDLITKVNEMAGKQVLTFQSGQLTLDAGTQDLEFQDLAGSTVLKTLFGQESFKTQAATTEYATTLAAGEGKNAKIVVDGREVVSSTNSFNVNGVDFEINAVSKTDPDTGKVLDDPITINVSSDPDDVVDKIKTFIEEYNLLVDAIDSLTKEKATSGYEPLTDEQKAEMTEDQIKTWETEAKKGLLRNDTTLRGILTKMRSSLYQKVESAGISLYDIGITTETYNTSSYANNGRLEMTDAGEKKLREKLASNPDAVRQLFTDSTEGLAVRLESVIDDAVRTNSTNQGSLVALAGTEVTTGNNESTLSRQLTNIENQITLLQTRLENEYTRYWKRFSALETAISNMNSQSSWLQSFGS